MIFADGKGGKMEQLEKWCWVHKKACLVTGIMGLLLAPFLWPVFLAVIVQSLTIGLPIAAGICCYKYLNEKKEKTNENFIHRIGIIRRKVNKTITGRVYILFQ